ncbi:MAG TPA: GAP family protein [Actinoplanes sp.]|nr:GAP family protein [Actinoplanes sp.]
MGTAISEVLPFAVGVAISPVPIIAVILVLFSARARVNGLVFLVGWVLGVAVVSIAIYLIAAAGDVDTESGPSDTANWIKIVLGVFLVRLAVRDWRKQHATSEPAPPKWMASIDSLTPLKAGGLGLLLSGVNPKNLTLSLAAGAALAQAGVSGSEAAVGLAVFIVIASASIAVPVAFALAGGQRAKTVLDGWKAWLTTHDDAVMAVLFLVFGVVVFSQGLRGLTA